MTEVTPRVWTLPAGHAYGPPTGDLRWHQGPCHLQCAAGLRWWTTVYRQRVRRTLEPTAVWGGPVQQAVLHVQELAGLPRTGVLDRDTWVAVTTVARSPLPKREPGQDLTPPKPKGWRHRRRWDYWRKYSRFEVVYGTDPDAPPWWPGRPFGPHESGWHVRMVQDLLGVAPTGHFNPDTVKRVKGWQRLRGLPVSGVVDIRMAVELDPGPYDYEETE